MRPYTILLLVAVLALGGAAQAQQNLVPPDQTALPAASDSGTAEAIQGDAVYEEDEETGPQQYSFGTVPFSLMFTPEQVTAMKNVLTIVEVRDRKTKSSTAGSNQDILPFLLSSKPTVTGEPATYPSFYLSTIMYRSPMDWSIWVNGQRITPKNNKPPLEVAAVAPASVTFRWKPEYMSSLKRRYDEKKFAPTDKLKNRLTTSDTIEFNEQEGTVLFTLRSNQSFSSAHMSTFEGKIAAEVVPSLDAAVPKTDAKTKSSGSGKPDAATMSLLNDMAGAAATDEQGAGSTNKVMDSRTAHTLQELLKNQQNLLSITKRGSSSTQPAESP